MQSVVAWQPSLFDGGPLALDLDYGAVRRIQLDADSWVEHLPGWVRGSDVLFEDVLEERGWAQRSRRMYDQRVREPRLTAPWGGSSGAA